MTDDHFDPFDSFRKEEFLPTWLTTVQMILLAAHYDELTEKNYRYRIRTLGSTKLFCIIDNHTDELYYHVAKNNVKSRRIWSSADLERTLGFVNLLNKYGAPPTKEETHLSQRVRYANPPKNKTSFASPVETPKFHVCKFCQGMVKEGHTCVGSNNP